MFYDNLKTVCSSKGTTPTALCKELGLSTSLPTNWKNGSAPRLNTIQQMADHLGVPVSSLTREDPDEDDGWLDLSTVLPQLTEDEQKLLDAYRDNPTFRAAVDALYTALVPTKKDESSAV